VGGFEDNCSLAEAAGEHKCVGSLPIEVLGAKRTISDFGLLLYSGVCQLLFGERRQAIPT